MHVGNLWWLDGGIDPLGDDPTETWDDNTVLDFEDIFSDVIGTVGKIATAPIDLVASVLPKPVRKPLKAAAALTSPTAALGMAGQAIAGGGSKPVRSRPTSMTGRSKSYRPRSSAPIRNLPTGRPSMGGAARGASDQLMTTLVKALTAKGIVETGAATRPRLAAKSSKDKSGTAVPGSAMLQVIGDAVEQKLGPQLSRISGALGLAENQRLATSEHLSLKNRDAYRRKVLKDLDRIASARLPLSSPTRQRIRRVGIMSGLL